MDVQDQKKTEATPQPDTSYEGREKENKENLIESGLQWYQKAMKPVSDWLYELFNSQGGEEIKVENPTSIQQAVDRYTKLPKDIHK